MNKVLFIKVIVICLLSIKAYAIEKVVLFGDSLMAGYGLPNEHHLSVVLEQRLKDQGKNIKVINGSVSGSTSSGGLNRAEWSLSDEDIDLMILGLGANDMLRGIPPNETEQNLEKIIKNKINPVNAELTSEIEKESDEVYDEQLKALDLIKGDDRTALILYFWGIVLFLVTSLGDIILPAF